MQCNTIWLLNKRALPWDLSGWRLYVLSMSVWIFSGHSGFLHNPKHGLISCQCPWPHHWLKIWTWFPDAAQWLHTAPQRCMKCKFQVHLYMWPIKFYKETVIQRELWVATYGAFLLVLLSSAPLAFFHSGKYLLSGTIFGVCPVDVPSR